MPDPLFPQNRIDPIYPTATQQPSGSLVPPESTAQGNDTADPAVDMIRQKIRDLYAEEPDAAQEIAEIKTAGNNVGLTGSKHQQYMAQLQSSGKSLAEIQTDWHNYYVSLPDHEKYEVWQEFYVNNGANPAYQQFTATGGQSAPAAPERKPAAIPEPARIRKRQHTRAAAAVDQAAARIKTATSPENVTDIKKRIAHTVKTVGSANGGGKLQKKHHLQSLAFGLASGLVVVFIFLFGFFNELLIAPFIQPSRHVNDTPVIVDTASAVVSGGPKVIIPKINVEIPVDYSQTTTDESQIELALDKGIVHYPTTVKPGEAGNAAFFGHSSNNIFNPGKYKFAFVLLHELVEGDTFYLSYHGQTYAYRVFNKRIVEPTEVGVLGPVAGKTATATLITCDPPGTSLHRLVVIGEQISPDPAANGQPATPPAAPPTPVETASANPGLPGNGPTLWSRIWGAIF